VKHTSSRKGDMAEYYAVTWLWDNGYEVFKNCGCTGAIDLVAIDRDNNILYIDVKTFDWHRTAKQKEIGVTLLEYNTETRKLKFVEHKK